MKTRVVNKYKERYTVYIGRGSKWGNPFVVGKDGTRADVIIKHRDWLIKWILHSKEIIINGLSNKWVIEHLKELEGETLGCFCKPLVCHGDTFVELLLLTENNAYV